MFIPFYNVRLRKKFALMGSEHTYETRRRMKEFSILSKNMCTSEENEKCGRQADVTYSNWNGGPFVHVPRAFFSQILITRKKIAIDHLGAVAASWVRKLETSALSCVGTQRWKDEGMLRQW